jgi:hypothetical protein
VLRGNVAAAPAAAPLEVKRAIWAANQLRSKRYRYGGGHRSFVDSGYDCSGTVSYALGAAGLVKSPMPSSGFKNFGKSGQGKWITVYARNGHTFAVIAGLRLDTTAWNTMRVERGEAPRWRATPREPRGFVARHPAGLEVEVGCGRRTSTVSASSVTSPASPAHTAQRARSSAASL